MGRGGGVRVWQEGADVRARALQDIHPVLQKQQRAFLVISILTECLPHTWPELLQPEAQQQASTDNFPLLSQSHRLELPRLDLSSYCPMPFLVGSSFHLST